MVAVSEPIVVMLGLVDGDAPCMGKVYEGMDKMIEKLDAIDMPLDEG